MNSHILLCDLDSFPLNKLPRRENVLEADSAQQFRTYAVADHVHNFGSILRGIDVDTERPLALGQPDHAGDLAGAESVAKAHIAEALSYRRLALA